MFSKLQGAQEFPYGIPRADVASSPSFMARQYKLQGKGPATRSGIDYRSELNDAQYAAVTSWPPGPSIVLAGAGSGKTRVLTYRVAWLLDRGLPPSSILLLTFTNKAAREMIERVEHLLPFDISGLWGGTFHSIGNRMLRRHADLIGWRQGFSIMDREDQKDLLGSVIAAAGIEPKQERFPKAEVVGDILSLAINTGAEIGEVLEARYEYFAHFEEKISRVAERYLEKKKATNCMDFDDLLVQSVGLLRDHAEVRENYRKRFQFVLVDEFQDTNAVQSEFIELLTADGGGSLMVVGDDAQSIYSWRGADCENILAFPENHPGCSMHRIETNYRSVPEVLALANASIARNERQFPKNLVAARAAANELPALVPLQDPRQQARFVADRVLELRDEGMPLSEMAVLYRAHYHSMDVQLELTARGIPFRITSGLRFFEQAHIKDVAAFLRLAVNPRDEVAFFRLVRLLPGIGTKSAEKMWTQWLHATAGGGSRRHEKVFDSIKVPAKAASDWKQLAYTMDEIVHEDGTLAKPVDALKSVTLGIYDDWMKAKFTNYSSRKQDLEQLSLFAAGHKDLEALLAELSLLSGVDVAADGRQEQDKEMLTLSSVHQAKGLEWKAVFLIWLAEGMFPNSRAIGDDDSAGIEEERRLFYVAATRAKDLLHLCYPVLWPGNHSGDILQRPSQFLAELPAGLMETWEVEG
jgi:DNA helicase-2/ATP-dependent DNA helicase PcrA